VAPDISAVAPSTHPRSHDRGHQQLDGQRRRHDALLPDRAGGRSPKVASSTPGCRRPRASVVLGRRPRPSSQSRVPSRRDVTSTGSHDGRGGGSIDRSSSHRHETRTLGDHSHHTRSREGVGAPRAARSAPIRQAGSPLSSRLPRRRTRCCSPPPRHDAGGCRLHHHVQRIAALDRDVGRQDLDRPAGRIAASSPGRWDRPFEMNIMSFSVTDGVREIGCGRPSAPRQADPPAVSSRASVLGLVVGRSGPCSHTWRQILRTSSAPDPIWPGRPRCPPRGHRHRVIFGVTPPAAPRTWRDRKTARGAFCWPPGPKSRNWKRPPKSPPPPSDAPTTVISTKEKQ